MKQVRLLLLRHGECEGGAILRGRVDVPLSDKGWRQMSAAVAAQATVCHGIYSSTSKRCAEFAKAFAAELHSSASVGISLDAPAPLPLKVNLLEELQEIAFGDWDGCLLDDLYQQDGERMAAYWQDPWAVSPPNGETMASFEARIDGAIEQILNKEFAQLALDDEQAHGECNANVPTANIWVLTHGGVIRHLMARALGAVRTVGFYSQLTLPVAAVVTINVLEDKHGTRYWRLDWPSGHGD
ncbi:histidine phosphatase family protein [Shewanella xiamenensis]|uniref:histidine phosphatase family protein n=1 Tax=Shewanella xiamenensis TaxID=332186 RepID=UPI002E7B69BA|nr:histidine phosphatase family protein [Shewanella xiamenensis]MEE1979377.1 histidine phosphatase family protein [Shewanella xiamenensis]